MSKELPEIDLSKTLSFIPAPKSTTSTQPAYGWGPHIQTHGKRVACETLPKTGMTVTVKGGVAIIEQKNALKGVKVLFGNETLPKGTTVYIKTDTAFCKEVYAIEQDGQRTEFILVPEEHIVLKK